MIQKEQAKSSSSRYTPTHLRQVASANGEITQMRGNAALRWPLTCEKISRDSTLHFVP